MSLITPHDQSGKLDSIERIEPMAKGQMRSNRETRKPKQEKAPVRVAATFANQKKDATKKSLQGGKHER